MLALNFLTNRDVQAGGARLIKLSFGTVSWHIPRQQCLWGAGQTLKFQQDVVCGATMHGSRPQINKIWFLSYKYPDSKGQGANMGPTWVLSAPDGPHVGPMNLAIIVHIIRLFRDQLTFLPLPAKGACGLLTIAGPTILIPCQLLKCMRLMWRSYTGKRGFALQINCSNPS